MSAIGFKACTSVPADAVPFRSMIDPLGLSKCNIPTKRLYNSVAFCGRGFGAAVGGGKEVVSDEAASVSDSQ